MKMSANNEPEFREVMISGELYDTIESLSKKTGKTFEEMISVCLSELKEKILTEMGKSRGEKVSCASTKH